MPAKSIRVRVAILLYDDNRVLLVRHQKAGRTYWLLPGGGVEYGETMAEAASREAKEETGLVIEIGPLAIVWETLAPDRTRHLINLCFHARAVGGHLRAEGTDNMPEVRWVPLADLGALVMHPPLADPLRRLVDHGRQSEVLFLGPQWSDDTGALVG